jgi:predicted DNA-binding WGR domain protein
MKLYKRNAQGKPIFWEISDATNEIIVTYGLVGKFGHKTKIKTNRQLNEEIKSQVTAKRKEGYKELSDLYDNAPNYFRSDKDLVSYLNTYLPKDNTHADGTFIPMLCKTLEDNKPFTKSEYFGEYKIDGERCLITAHKDNGLFDTIHLKYHSRQGIDWTNKLSYLDEYLIPIIPNYFLTMMIDEGVALDGELYLPGYTINEVNSFIKNTELPQHYQLQFWCYDLAIDSMPAIDRYSALETAFRTHVYDFKDKAGHINNEKRFILLPAFNNIHCIEDAIRQRDNFISLGFEGLVIRDAAADYQFGGKRNNSMLKFKKIEDGLFKIIDIVPEGIKRRHLPKFICCNDINDELFECTINKKQDVQEEYLINKDKYIGKFMKVEYRARSGVKQVPFHAKGIDVI